MFTVNDRNRINNTKLREHRINLLVKNEININHPWSRLSFLEMSYKISNSLWINNVD